MQEPHREKCAVLNIIHYYLNISPLAEFYFYKVAIFGQSSLFLLNRILFASYSSLSKISLHAIPPLLSWSSSFPSPSTSVMSTRFPTYFSSSHEHVTLTFSPVVSLVFPMLQLFHDLFSLLILLHLVIVRISVTSTLLSWSFFIGHASSPYIIAGLATVLYNFPFIPILTFLSHKTPATFFQFLQHDCIL